jgi:hypothetical protein
MRHTSNPTKRGPNWGSDQDAQNMKGAVAEADNRMPRHLTLTIEYRRNTSSGGTLLRR